METTVYALHGYRKSKSFYSALTCALSKRCKLATQPRNQEVRRIVLVEVAAILRVEVGQVSAEPAHPVALLDGSDDGRSLLRSQRGRGEG